MTELVKNIYTNLHRDLHKRRHWKRCWVRVRPGHSNYARLKPDDDTVVQIGYMHLPGAYLASNPKEYRRFRDSHQFARMYVVIELHPGHAILGVNYGQPQTIKFDWPAIAKEYKLNPDDLERRDSYTLRSDNVDITVNNLFHNYLHLQIHVVGAHLQTLRRFQWYHRNQPQFKTCGPARYDYETRELTSVRGDYTKTVDEPARLELNRTVRKAMAKVRALGRFSDGIELDEVRRHFARCLTENATAEQAIEQAKLRIDPQTVLDSLDKMELSDKAAVHDAMLNLSLAHTKVYRTWRLELSSDKVENYINSTVQYTPHPGNTTSAGLAWLRQYLQLGLGVVEYRAE